MSLPFSAAADRNKEAIGDALSDYFNAAGNVLEIGSGTGQHAVYLTERFKSLHWQPTDRAENLTAIKLRVAAEGGDRIAAPLEIDVSAGTDLPAGYAFAFSANTAHIMSLVEVRAMFALLARSLEASGYFALYGPFSYGGKHTSAGNQNFDAMLRQQASHMGIRDKAELDGIAFEAGFDFVEDIEMPANNRILVWRR